MARADFKKLVLIVGVLTVHSFPEGVALGVAYVFIIQAREFLPYGFGFAAGAMIYLVLHDIFPDALAAGEAAGLEHRGRRLLVVGIMVGFVVMTPVMVLTE